MNVLKTFPNKYFNCCITSPPYYGLRSYGSEPQIWDGKSDCEHDWDTTTIKWHGDRGTSKRKEVFDDTFQVEGTQSSFCKKCHAWRGELGLEPTPQLYIKHLLQIFTEVKRVVRDDGVIFVNIADSYGGAGGTQTKSLLQIPKRFSIAMTDELQLILRNDIIWETNKTPTSTKDRFTVNYEWIFFFTKKKKYYFEQQLEPANYDGRKDTKYKGSQKYDSPNYTPDGSVNTFAKQGHERWVEKNGIKMRNKRAIWKIANEPLKEDHFASFPQKLVQIMIEAGCPKDGIVLDPFIGSGTTGIVARKLGRDYIGIDLKYHNLNEKRHEKELGFFR